METAELLQIKVKITDKTALERLTPEMMTAYLAQHEWTCKYLMESHPRATEWWKGDAWLLIPMDKSVGDYSLRVALVIQEVGIYEDRSQLAIYIDILEST